MIRVETRERTEKIVMGGEPITNKAGVGGGGGGSGLEHKLHKG